jgi:hypothetical protein
MSVFTTQGYRVKLVAGVGSYADKTFLDLFADEEIKVSNNITDLFDIGAVPGTFTRTITLPGTKVNNAFFEQYYDISVYNPDIFNTNQKVEAYLDFDGIYLVNGYIQLQKVSVYENKFIDSYEINLFGIISNFSVEANRLFLTDLDNLSIYNHTSSLANITASWQGDLFSGSIVYPMADYGSNVFYSIEEAVGIDDPEGALTVQNYKPAIKMKAVWDAIFDKLGFTYSGSFFEQPFVDNIYLFLNNNLKYPIYTELELENYGRAKVNVSSGSAYINYNVSRNTQTELPFTAEEFDYNNVLNIGTGFAALAYTPPISTKTTCNVTLNFRVTNTGGAGSGAPQFTLYFREQGSGVTSATASLVSMNTYLANIADARTTTVTETFTLTERFVIPQLPATAHDVYIYWTNTGANNFGITLNPADSRSYSSFEIVRINQAADGKVLQIPNNMPYGVSGIKLIDFIRGIQKKFNLIIYESKTNLNTLIIDTFDVWYKDGEYKDFNQYINLNEKIEFIPANTLAVNKIDFTDADDADYVSTLWKRTYNRTFGQAFYIDSGSYFSQGEFAVKTTLAQGPLQAVPGIYGFSGSFLPNDCKTYNIYASTNPAYVPVGISWIDCGGGYNSTTLGLGGFISVCSEEYPQVDEPDVRIEEEGSCGDPIFVTGSADETAVALYIPRYISNEGGDPARVLPRLFFYNGNLPAQEYYVEGYDFENINLPVIEVSQSIYPYFDNYNVVTGSLPSTGSDSLLFLNESAPLGSTPSDSLLSKYWDTYLSLLYNPRTRLVNAAAVIPLADYFDLELNDLVQFRGNYYHLRAVNDYNLTTGECLIQLLGPVINDVVSEVMNFGPAVSPSPFPTPSITRTISITPSVTRTPSFTPSITATPSATPTPTVTPTISITATPSITPSTSPPVVSATPTPSITPSLTVTPSLTPTPTFTPTVTVTPTITPSPSFAFDSDASAYMSAVESAGGFLSSSFKTAINNFYVGLKSDSLYTEIGAMWLFTGGTAAAHAIEGKAPSDADRTIIWSGSLTGSVLHTIEGVQPNGTTNTYGTIIDSPSVLVPSTSANDTSIGMYQKSVTANSGFALGPFASFTSPRFQLNIPFDSANTSVTIGSNFAAAYNNTVAPVGFWAGTRNSSTEIKLYKNGTNVATNSSTNTAGLQTNKLEFFGINGSSNLHIGNVQFAYVGNALDATQMSNLHSRVHTLQTALGRNY